MNRKKKVKEDGFKEIRDILKQTAVRLNQAGVRLDQAGLRLDEAGIRIDRLAIEIAELKESQKKTDEQQKKTDEQLKKTDEQLKKTDEQLKKTDEQLKKTDAQIKNLGFEIGNLTDGWGRFVEGLVAPSVPKLFSELGIKITGINERALRRYNGREMEIDLLCIGKYRGKKKTVLAVEVKSSLGIKSVKEYLENLSHFFEFFSEYIGCNLIGVVAGVRVPNEVVQFAEKRGLYVLAPSGDTMRILNHKKFKPKIW